MNQNLILKKYGVSYTRLTNRTMVEGRDEFPVLLCDLEIPPDYLSFYKNVKDYRMTPLTCVCFYEYDNDF